MKIIELINDFFHSNCKKSKDKTIPKKTYKDGKYKISKHAVDRMYERNITKGELHYNLYTKPLKVSEIEYDDYGRPAYVRYSKNTTRSVINPKTKCVASVRRYRVKELYKNNKK